MNYSCWPDTPELEYSVLDLSAMIHVILVVDLGFVWNQNFHQNIWKKILPQRAVQEGWLPCPLWAMTYGSSGFLSTGGVSSPESFAVFTTSVLPDASSFFSLPFLRLVWPFGLVLFTSFAIVLKRIEKKIFTVKHFLYWEWCNKKHCENSLYKNQAQAYNKVAMIETLMLSGGSRVTIIATTN